MAFRKTAAEYVKEPIGGVSPYVNGWVIDMDNNVYEERFGEYVKIGYGIPEWDAFIGFFPKLSLELAYLNFFAPRERGEFDIVAMAYGIVRGINGVINICSRFISILSYNLLSKYVASLILPVTERYKRLRLVLPINWFYESDDSYVTELSIKTTAFWTGWLLLPVILPIVFAIIGNYGQSAWMLLAIILLGINTRMIFFNIYWLYRNIVLGKEIGVNRW